MHDNGPVNRAFSAQAPHYDSDDKANLVIRDLRKQVYSHVALYMKPQCNILELNAGTGIDASYFVSQGHSVLATDLSDGMVNELHKKESGKLRVRQLSFNDLSQIEERFDYVFSNFGGLNCENDLKKITKHLPNVLSDGGYVTWVIMPPVCIWELLSILKGNKNALRRLNKEGVMAHIDGEYFRTWYHSLSSIKAAFGDRFELIRNEGLAAISPPPHRRDFPRKHPGFYSFLRRADEFLKGTFPFDRCADHIVVTFRMR
ncbi:MAG TPA: class I SAM-dependent methyltransferase [Cyclobacteriaceae bacterium]|nr:class I SAM-dependent methyltransferase [Cyclobacteriaceae bacterium]